MFALYALCALSTFFPLCRSAKGSSIADELRPLLSRCTIARVPALSPADFFATYRGASPVIFTRPCNVTAAARRAGGKASLRAAYGREPVVLASSNSFSHAKLPSTLAAYIDGHTSPLPRRAKANDTFYLFGDTLGARWAPLLDAYNLPPHAPPEDAPLKAWGAGGKWSGVAFHTHGAAFAETVVGRKHFWVAPPGARPAFDADESQLGWALRRAAAAPADADGVLGCTLGRGDVLYVPPMWFHATLNLRSWNFFFSVFTQELQTAGEGVGNATRSGARAPD
jgi:hypothetical protein